MKKYLLALIPPAALCILFLPLREAVPVMTFCARSLGAYWRGALGFLTALLPFSFTEIAGTALGLLAVVFIVLLITALVRRRGFIPAFKRVVALLTVILYGGAAFLWFWCSVYFAPPIYDGVLERRDISTEELTAAAVWFRDGANNLANKMPRGDNGDFDISADEIIKLSPTAFDNLTDEFPALSGSHAVPKKMLYSELMSRTGFTGIYLGLTGEANINVNMPKSQMPVTAAHELAHSRGVGAEDAANFFGIAACITSEIEVFEYSGYLSGLIHVQNALLAADFSAYIEVAEGYGDMLRHDLGQSASYWAEIREKNEDSPVMEAVTAAVTETYDGYLRANTMERGMETYGECVDLLVIWQQSETSGD